MDKKREFTAITALKGILCLSILLAHATAGNAVSTGIGGWFAHHGGTACSFFFVISGFLLCYRYRSVGRIGDWCALVKRRVLHLLPIHYVTLFFCVAVFLVTGRSLAGYSTGFWGTLPSLFLVQDWIPYHPVKTITTGEGGAVTTNDPELYAKLCAFRAHGTHKDGEMARTWEYEMRELGYNYRITDFQCALGCSQLKKLDAFKKRRREIVAYYNEHLGLPHLIERDFSNACFHLYPILVPDRKDVYFKAREVGLGLQVHYIPVPTQKYYRDTFGYKFGDYPKAEEYYAHCISLPLYPTLTDEDLAEIVRRIKSIV